MTLVFAASVTRLAVDAGFNKMVPLEHPYMKVYREYEKVFGGANRVAIAIVQKDGDIYNRDFMARLKGLTDDVFLLLHLIASYVYLGGGAFWEFVAATAGHLLAPLRWLPLRLAGVDLAPLAGAVVILLLLHWLPGWLWAWSPRLRAALWPQ